jgi:TolB-like protein
MMSRRRESRQRPLPRSRRSRRACRSSCCLANLSNDPEQQYFADGITGDLTADLSRIPDMLVISRDTAFHL